MSLAELQPRKPDAAPVAAARPVIMRQYELVEKVQAYNPNADEDSDTFDTMSEDELLRGIESLAPPERRDD